MTMAAISAALSIVVGALLGAVYDTVRFFRVLFSLRAESPLKKRGVRPWISFLLVALGDLFFWAVSAVTLCIFFFLTGDGRMRWYGLAGAGLGFFCYYHTVGRLFIGVVSYLCAVCRRIFAFLWNALCIPARALLRRLCEMPIVLAIRARREDRKQKRKAQLAARKRRKRMKKSGCCRNGL